METQNPTKFTILMYPWLAHAHISSFLQLAKKLSANNFHIYFCSTPINILSIRKQLQGTPNYSSSIKILEIHLPSSPDFPPHFHTTKNAPLNLRSKLYRGFQMSMDGFSGILSSVKPDLLLYDVLQHWAVKLASSMGIPAVHFSTTGAASNSFFFHFSIKKLEYHSRLFPYPGMYLRGHEWKSLSVDASHVANDTSREDYGGDFAESKDICLIKSCRAIEGKYIDYLSVLFQKKVLPVGQLVTRSGDEENDAEIMEWLSDKVQFSTLFISFGSENSLSKHQMEETAKGLELCDVNFLWVVRSPVGETMKMEEEMPEGFLRRTRERGMIVQRWVPQDKILAHKSVGAFMSHCGMSSTLETACFGVPVIALPLKLDQYLNARLLVEAGVAAEAEKDENGNWRREAIADAIKRVFSEKKGEKSMRFAAAELSEKMEREDEDAIMAEAAEQLRRICLKHKQNGT
ncbi:mogroside IIIx synthase-like [Henckelia pumila]|uniref:mogroside IIIx synthase-like n=1 Tax=Henckelia pumila TaxID=405737 RepID=UPI003C6E95CB